jgi:hypothetical protein
MSVESDIATLQQQISDLTQQLSSLNTTVSGHTTSISGLNTTVSSHTTSISGLNTTVSSHTTSISGLNTSLDTKANIDSPTFTGNPKVPTPASSSNDTSIASTAFVNTKLGSFSGSTDAPSAPGAIADITMGDDFTLSQAGTSGSAGSSSAFSKADHKHPGDITRAPVNNPILTGKPQSMYMPDGDNEDDRFVIPNVQFVKNYCRKVLEGGGSGTTVTPPLNSGEADVPSQPGGNSEDLTIGGGAIGGIKGDSGGEGGKWGYSFIGNPFGPEPEPGSAGADGTDGGPGSVEIYTMEGSNDTDNWDIATYDDNGFN